MKNKLLLMQFLLPLSLFGQQIQNEVVVPPNLNSNKLENANLFKTNLYNGVIVDEIPIYTIAIKGFTIPIVLSHSFNGFKPSETASWVGLGWNLQVGGGVSRIIRGKDDEFSTGYRSIADYLNIPNPIKSMPAFNSFISNLTKEQLKNFAEGLWDGLPDEYMITANALSAKFFQLQDGNFVTIPFKPVKISRSAEDQWVATDESGNTYYFGKSSSDDRGWVEESTSQITTNPGGEDLSEKSKTRWLLRKIQLVTGESILFTYEPEYVIYDSADTETVYYLLSSTNSECKPKDGTRTVMTTSHEFYRLSSIETPYEKITFKKGELRKDLNSTNSYALGEIEVKNSNNELAKGYLFYYSYLGNSASRTSCRMMLDSLVEYGSSLLNKKPRYLFTYDKSVAIPPYTTKSIDHWGFYNGSPNTSLVPKIISNSLFNEFFLQGGVRDVNPSFSKVGLLKQVNLPTKGSWTYEYEANNFGYIGSTKVNDKVFSSSSLVVNVSSPNGSISGKSSELHIEERQSIQIQYSLQGHKPGGALPTDQDPAYVRITKDLNSLSSNLYYVQTADKNVNGTMLLTLSPGVYYVEAKVQAKDQQATITIDYKRPQTDVSGNLVYEKNRLTGGHRIARIIKSDENGLNSITQNLHYTCVEEPDRSSGVLVSEPSYEYRLTSPNIKIQASFPYNGDDCVYIARTSNSISALASDDSHVTYTDVTTTDSQNAKTISSFTSAKNYGDQIFPRNGLSVSRSYLRGLLTKEYQYSKNSNLVKSVEYNYNFSRPENRNGIAGIYIVEYLHKDIIPDLSRYALPYSGILVSEWCPLDSVVETLDGVTATSKFCYDNPLHAQVSRASIASSRNRYSYTLYPNDYSNGGSIDFIGDMKTRHIINKPVEKIIYEVDADGSIYIISGEIYTYKKGDNCGQIESIYKLNIKEPLPLSMFRFSNMTESGVMPYNCSTPIKNFVLEEADTHYSSEPFKTVDLYDCYSNVLQYHERENIPTSFIWGYSKAYPVVKVENMDYKTLDSTILSIRPDFQDFVKSLDKLTSAEQKNRWELFNKTLRSVLPSKCMATTYTFKPSVGVTSITNSSGTILYYEYDEFGRLLFIRDRYGAIQNHCNYNYSLQKNGL